MPALASPTAKPTTSTKATKAASPKPKETVYVPPPDREVVYPLFRCDYYISGMDDREDIAEEYRPGPITQQMAKDLLGWQTQAEYTASCIDNPSFVVKGADGEPIESPTESQVKEATLFANNPDINVLLTDYNGDEVTCWNNNNNRPYRGEDCKKYVQSILTRNWAGPLTFDGQTCNGETVIISRTANVESGQHRLIALILACQIWNSAKGVYWKKFWLTEPVLESLVVFGASDDPRVLMTIDNVIPRDGSDTIYTSEIFKDVRPGDRRKLAKMLERAVELVWKRTGVVQEGSVVSFRTNPETMNFLRNHPRLEKCVRRLYEEDKQNGISKLHVSAGQCAGLLYLMGSCATSDEAVTEYRNSSPRKEEALSWDKWDKALEFWRKLVRDNKENDHPIAQALKQIPVEEDGAMARVSEKHAVLCKAWRLFVEGEPLTTDAIALQRNDPLLPEDDYVIDANQEFHLKEGFDFGGIDLGNKVRKIEPVLTAEEVAAAKEQERQELAKKAQAKLETAKKKALAASSSTASGNGSTPSATAKKGLFSVPSDNDKRDSKLKLLRKGNPGCVIICQTKSGAFAAYGEDASYISDLVKPVIGAKDDGGLLRADIPPQRLDDVCGQIMAKGKQIALIEQKDGKDVRRLIGTPTASSSAAPKTKPTPPPTGSNGKKLTTPKK